MNTRVPPEPDDNKPWTHMVHTTFVDGSQAFDLFDTKEDANAFLSGVLTDAEIASWTAYEVLKHSSVK